MCIRDRAVKQVSVWLMNYITFSSCGFVYFLREIPIVLMAVAVLWNCWCQVVLQKSAGKCLNCLERNASLRLPVCHHKVLCEVCYMNTNECPTCQAAITIQQWHWMMMHEGRSQCMGVWVYGRRVWIYSSCWVGRRSASQCCCVSFWLAYSVMVHAQPSLVRISAPALVMLISVSQAAVFVNQQVSAGSHHLLLSDLML